MMKDHEFRWIEGNIDHIDEHGVQPAEAEYVVGNATPPWPRQEANRKFRVRGQGSDGRWLQVVFVVDDDQMIFVIHARPLTDKEKRQCRRSQP